MIPLNKTLARKDESPSVYGRHQTVFQKQKIIKTPNTGCENIQVRHMDGIRHRKMHRAINEKREMTHGRNGTSKSRKIRNLRKKEKILILGNIGSGHHQTTRDERKNQNRVS